MRLIDADALIQEIRENNEGYYFNSSAEREVNFAKVDYAIDRISEAPTVEERPQGECKTCKYYHPYFEQFTNIPRGDGYCVIARMTPEGMTTINCNDHFGCSDYQKGGTDMRGGRE